MKKFISHILLVLMLFAGFSFGIAQFTTERVNAAGVGINDTVSYGGNKWIVVSNETLGSGDDTAYLVLSYDALPDVVVDFGDNAEWNGCRSQAYLNGGEYDGTTYTGYINNLEDVDTVALKVKIQNSETETEVYPGGFDSNFEYKKSTITPASSGDTAFLLSPGEWIAYQTAVGEENAVNIASDWHTRSWCLSWGEDYTDAVGEIYGSETYYPNMVGIAYAYNDKPIRPAMYLKAKYFKANPTGETTWIIKTDEPTPTPTPTPSAAAPMLAKMTSKGAKAMNFTWSKVAGAEGYDIYLSKCNHGGNKYTPQLVKSITGNKTAKWTKKGLKKNIPYKGYVKAYKMENGKKTYIGKSLEMHAYTNGGNKKYTNAKSVSVKKTSVSLAAGKTHKIKASVKKLKAGKALLGKTHTAKLRYFSSNTSVATVNGNGTITAVVAGKCKVYAVAANGARKAVTVTVK